VDVAVTWFLRLPPGAYLDAATNSIRGVEDRPVSLVDADDEPCPTCGGNGCPDCDPERHGG
jgi:hypothetical protein